VSTDAGVRVRSSVDWKDEVVTVSVESPVHDVTGVSGALKAQRQHPVVIRH